MRPSRPPGEIEKAPHCSSRLENTQNSYNDATSHATLPSAASKDLKDVDSGTSVTSADPVDHHTRANSLTQLQAPDDTRTQESAPADKDEANPQHLTSPTSETAGRVIETPLPNAEIKDIRLDHPLVSAVHSQEPSNSSKNAHITDPSSITTTDPGDIPRQAGPLSSTSDVKSPCPSISGSSKLTASRSRHYASRRNTKVVRRRRGGQLNYSRTRRKPSSPGMPSSIALGKRPMGVSSIGREGGAFSEPRSSTPDLAPPVPSRTDSKLRTDSLSTNEALNLAIEALLQPPIPDPISAELPAKVSANWPLVDTLPPEPVNRLPGSNIHSKENKRASLLTASYAATPAALDRYGKAVQVSTKGNTLGQVVPLSDACPLMVGSLALRQKLCSVAYTDQEDPRVPMLLEHHDLELEKVSRSDQILLWHLAVHEEAKKWTTSTLREPLSIAIDWNKIDRTHSKVPLTLDNLIRWIRCKQQALNYSERLRKREFEKLVASASPSRSPLMLHQNGRSQEFAPQSEAELFLNNPAAIWLNIYRILRRRGISEKELDRETIAQLMTLPRNSRHVYVDTLAKRRRARSIDNAYLDHRPQGTYPSQQSLTQDTTQEGLDTIPPLPSPTHFLRSKNPKRPLRTKPPPRTNSLSPITYVPPFRIQEEHLPTVPIVARARAVSVDGARGRSSRFTSRRVSVVSQFSVSTGQSEGAGRWRRFRERVRRVWGCWREY